MTIAAGTNLGPYKVLLPIGAGGMGEVYKALDTRLDRTVAIKILPDHLSDRAELRERFEREARTVASLNHAHICTLHDIGRQDGTDYLVMEYLEGETLAQRLTKGPLPLDQVLRYAIEIADALDKAHRKGITHRDLKPGNIMLTKSGTKLLDFGLAKLKQEVAPANVQLSQLPTAGEPLTAQGTIVGTLQYMAPEQLEGKEVDARTDIFAFGTVVYEMATGKRAFEGKSQASLIAKILETDPPPISSLQPMTPPALDRIVKRCLAKEPDERWQSANDLTNELKWIVEGGSLAGVPVPVVSRRKRWPNFACIAAIAIVMAALATSVLYFRRAPVDVRSVRFTIGPPERATFYSFPSLLGVSPDGALLAFAAQDSSGRLLLWVRALDSLTAQPLLGTDGGTQPFWSPDSRFIAFSAENKLKKIAVSGGPSQTVTSVNGAGVMGTWNRDGVILFGPNAQSGANMIQRVPAAGGTPVPVTTLDSTRQQDFHAWPHFLPDGRHFLYFAHSANPENSAIYVGALDAKDTKLLLNASSFILYSPPGYLLFVREGTLMAQQFDSDRLALIGDAFPIAEDVQTNPANSRAAFTISENGVLAYRTGGATRGQPVWTDLAGKELVRSKDIDNIYANTHFSLSPDEKRVAVDMTTTQGRDLWLLDMDRGATSRFSMGLLSSGMVWSSDSTWLTFEASRAGVTGLYRKLSNGAGSDELLLSATDVQPTDWSKDGRFLLYQRYDPKTKWDLWVLPLFGDRKPKLFLQTEFDESQGQFSPDGRWVAYASDESGRPDIYVQPFPGPGPKIPISTAGGVQPKWSRDGKELFYRVDGTGNIMVVAVKADERFEAGVPQLLSAKTTATSHGMITGDHYAISADGKRVFTFKPNQESSTAPVTVVLNWTAGFKK